MFEARGATRNARGEISEPPLFPARRRRKPKPRLINPLLNQRRVATKHISQATNAASTSASLRS